MWLFHKNMMPVKVLTNVCWKTGLTADRFAEYFAEFCARSYRDERFEFTEVQFEKYFNELRERQKGLEEVTASDFRMT